MARKYMILTFALLAMTASLVVAEEYKVGVDDVIDISVLKPDQMLTTAMVAPDGTVSFPYIGNVPVRGLTLKEIEQEIQNRLSNGYMKYPVVSVQLKESRSRKFFVYGEVNRPGSFPLEENMTVLKAISMAGGFTKYGSSSRVKLLRPKTDGPGYATMAVDIKAVMDGDSAKDLLIQPEDMVVVSEGIF